MRSESISRGAEFSLPSSTHGDAGSGHVLSAIHLDDLTSDVAAELFGCEVKEGADAFLGRADPVHGNGRLHGGKLFGGGVAIMERGGDHPRRYGVDADPVLHEFLGPAAGGGGDEPLGRSIDHRARPAAVAR